MMPTTQVTLLLQQLKRQYPTAFKGNYLFYSQIKIRGIWDKAKLLIPWVLAAMIFVPISLMLGDLVQQSFVQISEFQAQSYAMLAILLFLMLSLTLILYQIQHSSYSLYQLLRHTPIKMAIVILMQALNLVFIQSSLLMWSLFFFGVSFGFVRFYRENLFKENSQNTEHYQLQQLRKICFWAYKQTCLIRLKLRFYSSHDPRHAELKRQLNHYAGLYTRLLKYEHQYCKTIKHLDVDSYLDENS